MTTIRTDKARQGRRGLNVLYVLVASLVLAGLVWIGVEIYGESIDPPAPTTEQAPAASPTTPAQPSQ